MSSKVGAAERTSTKPDEALIRLRRERKRATDRTAQREHRRRQRLYIEDLESQLALARNNNENEQIANLLEENEKLRKDLEKYRGFFSSVEDLVMEEWQQDNNAKRRQPSRSPTGGGVLDQPPHASVSARISSEENLNSVQAPGGDDSATPEVVAQEISVQPAVVEPREVGNTPAEVTQNSWDHLSPQGAFDWSSSAFAFEQMVQDYPPSSAAYWNKRIISGDQSQIIEPTSTTLLEENLVPLTATSTDMAATISFPALMSGGFHELDPALILTNERRTVPLIHQLLPRILEADNAEDQHIQSIIERARTHSIRLDPPTLADFLCENPQNILSTAIKHYLEPVRRTRRTIEFLATYWVLYLLLRWQINRDVDSYYNVPVWLRPTVTQTRVHHPIGTDLLAWPFLRDEIIMLSLRGSGNFRDILVDAGTYLEMKIPLHKFSLDGDGELLHNAITDLNNWKLADEFFLKHPSLRMAYDSSLQMVNGIT